MIADAINVQLLPRVVGAVQSRGGRIFVAFDLSASMWGSIKEQTNALAESVGGPWKTPNEARADQGMGPIAGGDALYPPRAAAPAAGGGGGGGAA
jgi:hypothetical protein